MQDTHPTFCNPSRDMRSTPTCRAHVAGAFKGESHILGAELINEPWAGDVIHRPTLLLPKIADLKNFQPAYDKLAAACPRHPGFRPLLPGSCAACRHWRCGDHVTMQQGQEAVCPGSGWCAATVRASADGCEVMVVWVSVFGGWKDVGTGRCGVLGVECWCEVRSVLCERGVGTPDGLTRNGGGALGCAHGR